MKLKELLGIKVWYSVLRDKDLTTSQGLLLSIFKELDSPRSIPQNSELSSFMGVTKTAISRNISELIKKGYLQKESELSDEEVFVTLSDGGYEEGCLFCGYDNTALDEHHYPIRAKDGGSKTISLCANCHREFHELSDHNRRLTFTHKTERLFK